MEESKRRNTAWIAIAVRAVLVAAMVVVFQGVRWMLLPVGLVLLIADLVRHIAPVKRKLVLVFIDLAIVVVFAVCTYWVRSSIEYLRFQVMEPQYSAAVEKALPEIREEGDEDWGYYKLDKFLPLSIRNKVEFRQIGDSTAVYFPVDVTFFYSIGFIYFSDETARELITDYDDIDDFNENWAYIKLY